MRVIVTGGGTGGHIYPAVAIGQAILREWPQTEVLFVGTETGMEKRIAPAAGFPFVSIDVEGLRRKFSFQAFRAAWKALQGLRQAKRIMHDFEPHLVIGTGGYVCLPVVWAAAGQRISTVIHEQNAIPGLTNRLLSRRVSRILLTFPETAEKLPVQARSKTVVTGLPIRREIMETSKAEGLCYFGFSPDKPVLLGVGGSRGAGSINKAMVDVCRKLGSQVQIIHITGTAGYEDFLQELKRASIDVGNCGNIIIKPYLHHMEYALACADLCVARAGASFISEMTAKGIPGILIPYPFAAENHQEYNARSLVQRGAAALLLDKELRGDNLVKTITAILNDEARRKGMAQKSKETGNPRAIENIVEAIKPYMK